MRFFGVGKIIPYMKKYRLIITIMILCGLGGSLTDILLPIYQRYALNHFVGMSILDTLPQFIIIYLVTIIFAGITNYISASRATQIEVSINRDLRNAAFKHLMIIILKII